MTIGEAHIMYKLLLDKLDSLALGDIYPREIDDILSLAQERFVKQRYGILNNKRDSFEESRKRVDDLKMIVTDFNLLLDDSYYNKFNTVTMTYQIDYSLIPKHWFTLRQMAVVTDLNCKCEPCTFIGNIREVQTDDYVQLKRDPFNTPTLEYPLALSKDYIDIDFGQRIDFLKYSVYYQNRYIRKPSRVSLVDNITFELSDHTHQEIVELAVNVTLEMIESQRFQTQKLLLTEQE
jgi:hypothetical protein